MKPGAGATAGRRWAWAAQGRWLFAVAPVVSTALCGLVLARLDRADPWPASFLLAFFGGFAISAGGAMAGAYVAQERAADPAPFAEALLTGWTALGLGAALILLLWR